MLKELFFHIWRDDVGSGWILFTIISFNFCLAFLTFVFCRAKAKNIKFSKKHSIYLIICALIMYQIIPLVLDFYASALYLYKYTQKAIKFEKLAIKTAIIPFNKSPIKVIAPAFLPRTLKALVEPAFPDPCVLISTPNIFFAIIYDVDIFPKRYEATIIIIYPVSEEKRLSSHFYELYSHVVETIDKFAGVFYNK